MSLTLAARNALLLCFQQGNPMRISFRTQRSLFKAIAFAFALSALPVVAQAPMDIRIALVIGNSAYSGKASLTNPGNDARAMAHTLKQLGFTVIELRDGNKVQMREAIAKVQEGLKDKRGVGMLYYAGHGLQLDWRNYMIPVDAMLTNSTDVPNQSIDVNAVVEAFRAAGNRMNIVVLDACRDNPFVSFGSEKGLAPMDAPVGTFLAYATAPGNVASDGDSATGNGLYTQYLLEELQKPIAKIEDVFKRVRLNVRKSSEGRQIPWESTSLEDDFYFNTGQVIRAIKPDEKAMALAFDQEKADWDKIKSSRNTDELYAYLLKYPNGAIAEQVQFRIDQLQIAKVVPQPNKNGVKALPPGTNRYAKGDRFTIEVTDGLSKESRTLIARVTSADNETVVFNNGMIRTTQMGAVIENRFGLKNPPVLGTPADIALGKQWRAAFTNLRPDGVLENVYWDYKVTALEDVEALGRSVKAFKVQGSGFANFPGGRTMITTTFWIDPSTMFQVKGERLFRSATGAIVEYESSVTLHYSPGPR
jgi:hypothetical protein